MLRSRPKGFVFSCFVYRAFPAKFCVTSSVFRDANAWALGTIENTNMAAPTAPERECSNKA